MLGRIRFLCLCFLHTSYLPTNYQELCLNLLVNVVIATQSYLCTQTIKQKLVPKQSSLRYLLMLFVILFFLILCFDSNISQFYIFILFCKNKGYFMSAVKIKMPGT